MFRISFSGLSFGRHLFDFQVDNELFNAFDYDEISSCNVNVNISLEKTERFLKLDFHFDGTYFVPCDRCLDPVEVPVNHEETLIVNFGNETDFDSEVWVISAKEHELILDNFIYETLVLLRPQSVMHNIDDCNPQMIEKLQDTSVSRNKKSTGNSAETDPRWDALKALKTKLDRP